MGCQVLFIKIKGGSEMCTAFEGSERFKLVSPFAYWLHRITFYACYPVAFLCVMLFALFVLATEMSGSILGGKTWK